MKNLLVTLLSVGSLILPHLSRADSTTQTLDFSNYSIVSAHSAGSALTFNFQPFTANGTLTSETLDLNLTESANESVRSTGSYAETIVGSLRMGNGSGAQLFSFTGTSGGAFSDTVSGTASTPSFVVTPSFNYDTGSFATTTGLTSFTLWNPGSFTNALTNKTNTFSINSAAITGNLTLTYNYTPAVPEPTTWALLLGGLGLLLWRYRAARA
jgi:hypothetical protein